MREEKDTEATRLLIWCTTEGPEDLDEERAYDILLCNDPREENPTAAGAYWLNRNSVYHVNVTLTHGDEGRAVSSRSIKEEGGGYHYWVDLQDIINKN